MNSPDIHTDADWKTLLAGSVCTPEALPAHLVSDRSGLNEVVRTYPMRVNPYYLSLIRHPGDPMARQAVPDAAELSDTVQDTDPLAEEKQSPVPNVIHRYPDRVVFLVSNQCALLCRHCMRKRRVGVSAVTDADLTRGIDYIQHHANVRDVVLSGGVIPCCWMMTDWKICWRGSTTSPTWISSVFTRVSCAPFPNGLHRR